MLQDGLNRWESTDPVYDASGAGFDSKACLNSKFYGRNCIKCFKYYATEFETEYADAEECIEAQCHYTEFCGAFGDSAAYTIDVESGPVSVGNDLTTNNAKYDEDPSPSDPDYEKNGKWVGTTDSIRNSGGEKSLTLEKCKTDQRSVQYTRATNPDAFIRYQDADFCEPDNVFEYQIILTDKFNARDWSIDYEFYIGRAFFAGWGSTYYIKI
jgi:hypothetical protein